MHKKERTAKFHKNYKPPWIRFECIAFCRKAKLGIYERISYIFNILERPSSLPFNCLPYLTFTPLYENETLIRCRCFVARSVSRCWLGDRHDTSFKRDDDVLTSTLVCSFARSHFKRNWTESNTERTLRSMCVYMHIPTNARTHARLRLRLQKKHTFTRAAASASVEGAYTRSLYTCGIQLRVNTMRPNV